MRVITLSNPRKSNGREVPEKNGAFAAAVKRNTEKPLALNKRSGNAGAGKGAFLKA